MTNNKPNYVRVVPVELLERVCKADASMGASAIQLMDGWVAMAELRAILAQPADQQGEQMARMPVERCYDVRAKMIIAFNEAKKAGGDLDDHLDAAYKSALRFSPNPDAQPATAKVDEHKLNIVVDKVDDICEKFELEGLHSHPTYKQFKRLHAELARAKLNGGQA